MKSPQCNTLCYAGFSGWQVRIMAGATFCKRGGVAAESLHPGHRTLAALSPRVLADLRATVTAPDLIRLGRQPSAQQVLKPHEARVLLAMLHSADAVPRSKVLLDVAA